MPGPAALITAAEIDSFARRLKELLALAHKALAIEKMLGGGAGASAPAANPAAKSTAKPVAKSTSKAAPRPASAAKKKADARRPGIPIEKVAALLGAKGQSLGDIATKLGESDRERVKTALRKLRDAKKAKLVGEHRSAKWVAV